MASLSLTTAAKIFKMNAQSLLVCKHEQNQMKEFS